MRHVNAQNFTPSLVDCTSCQGVSWILANLRKQLKTCMAFPACFLRAGTQSSLSLWNFYVMNVICAHMYRNACACTCITCVPVCMETWRQLQVSSTIQLLSTFSGLWECVGGQGLRAHTFSRTDWLPRSPDLSVSTSPGSQACTIMVPGFLH